MREKIAGATSSTEDAVRVRALGKRFSGQRTGSALGARSARYATALLCLALAPCVALAHHSFAMFDFTKTVTMTGEVKEFRWTNPHVILLVSGTPPGAKAPEVWSMELTSPGNLTRAGFSRHSFKPGDKIELDFHPLRDGQHGGAFRKAKLLETGQVLTSNLREAERPGLK